MTGSGLEHLEAWRLAKELAIQIYREVVPQLPADEKYNLSSQIKRAATSIPANIAEGYGRFYYQANIQFCYNARGSLEELVSHLIIARELQYIPAENCNETIAKCDRLGQLINGYIAYLKRTKQGEKELQGQLTVKEEPGEYIFGDVDSEATDAFDGSRFSNLDSRLVEE